MISIWNLQSGDTILIRNGFNIKDINTWISPIVRFFINLWRYIRGQKICPYNHIGMIAKGSDGKMYLYESVSNGYKRKLLTEKFANRKRTDFLILRPVFEFDVFLLESTCENLLNTPYDYFGTMFHQMVRQITDERIWIGKKAYNKAVRKLYCSEANALIYNKATDEKHFTNWPEVDPEDFWESYLFNQDSLYLK